MKRRFLTKKVILKVRLDVRQLRKNPRISQDPEKLIV